MNNRMLKRNRKKSKNTVAVIGLGYVGLPLAVLAAEKGYRVFGIDTNKKRVNTLNRGVNTLPDEPALTARVATKPFVASSVFTPVRQADFVIICVPTPVDHFYKPELTPVINAAKSVARNLRRGQTVILESTVNPGVCEEVVLPILSKGKMKVGRDFELAHCPERINPGDPKWHVGNIPRCVGATTTRGAEKTAKFYRSLISGEVRVMKSLKEAEATKIVENSFRDINIAFVNELAKSFDALGIDVYDVIQGSSNKPFAFMAHYPSIGVGGHCIPVDPYYLIERAWQAGFDHKFLRLAREINNSMPAYTVQKLQQALNDHCQRSLSGTNIGLLGVSYKANIGDVRESPSLKVVELLQQAGAKVHVYDPHIPDRSTAASVDEVLKKSLAVIVAVNHREFTTLDLRAVKRAGVKVIVDGKNCLSKVEAQRAGLIYRGIGR